MKLDKNGWGYGVFIMCVCMISTFVIIVNHYMTILMRAMGK